MITITTVSRHHHPSRASRSTCIHHGSCPGTAVVVRSHLPHRRVTIRLDRSSLPRSGGIVPLLPLVIRPHRVVVDGGTVGTQPRGVGQQFLGPRAIVDGEEQVEDGGEEEEEEGDEVHSLMEAMPLVGVGGVVVVAAVVIVDVVVIVIDVVDAIVVDAIVDILTIVPDRCSTGWPAILSIIIRQIIIIIIIIIVIVTPNHTIRHDNPSHKKSIHQQHEQQQQHTTTINKQ
mmetsp:Transcript_9819/g.17835  ORF Transcript_9819/g.17835 Transcript_9819/m.17835 type:complete len:230 (+) Transcript_9819:346-1035(+)